MVKPGKTTTTDASPGAEHAQRCAGIQSLGDEGPAPVVLFLASFGQCYPLALW